MKLKLKEKVSKTFLWRCSLPHNPAFEKSLLRHCTISFVQPQTTTNTANSAHRGVFYLSVFDLRQIHRAAADRSPVPHSRTQHSDAPRPRSLVFVWSTSNVMRWINTIDGVCLSLSRAKATQTTGNIAPRPRPPSLWHACPKRHAERFVTLHSMLSHFLCVSCARPASLYCDEYVYIQGVPGGMDKTSGECSLCWTIPI